MEDRASGLQLILRVFLPFTIGYYLSYLFRTISAVTAEPLTAEFSLSPSSLGLLTSAYFLTFAAAQLPIGVYLDRYGPRQVQAVLLVIAAGGAALFGASDGFLSLLAGRALIGLGVATALAAGLKATVLWFPKERVALVNGWMVMLGALGAVTATAPSEWLLAWIGWRGLFEWLAMATAVAAGAVYLLVPEAPSSPSTALPTSSSRSLPTPTKPPPNSPTSKKATAALKARASKPPSRSARASRATAKAPIPKS